MRSPTPWFRSYLLYYRLEPRRAYVAGAVPLAAVGLFAAAMAVVAALIR